MSAFDQFTRWRCEKCGKAGIDSWNKATFDGADFSAEPYPHIFGDNCQHCTWPVSVAYGPPDTTPRAIFGPNDHAPYFDYEEAAFADLERGGGVPLQPTAKRDDDWSGGCTALAPAPEHWGEHG